MAHLIPEYDITGDSWRNIFRFAHTIAPMWTELYRNEWADVEEVIRKLSFSVGTSKFEIRNLIM